MFLVLYLDDVVVFWFGVIVILGVVVGGVLGGWLVDCVGCKLSFLLCFVFFVVGFVVIIVV